MILSYLHQGSGAGNQLHRMVATRVLAMDKGYEWGMIYPENFKCSSFMNISFPEIHPSNYTEWFEKKIIENGIDIRGYDPEINFIADNTIIDGEFQDFRYFGHRLHEIRQWLYTDSLDIPEDWCIINFRGGEYTYFPELYLPQSYWDQAIQEMVAINPNMKFEVHTDDVKEAKKFFPHFECFSNIGLNWRSIRYASYLILSNSSFAILPALINERVKHTIAPRYWARHNTGIWALPQNYYTQFHYI